MHPASFSELKKKYNQGATLSSKAWYVVQQLNNESKDIEKSFLVTKF